MLNGLDIKRDNLLSTINSTDMGDLIKPLVKEIFLYDTFIAGTTHLKDESVLVGIKPGQWLTLKRENNRFDKMAIMIVNEKSEKLGYIPEKDNIVFARLMDAGKLLKVKVKKHEIEGYFHNISIGIYLIDY